MKFSYTMSQDEARDFGFFPDHNRSQVVTGDEGVTKAGRPAIFVGVQEDTDHKFRMCWWALNGRAEYENMRRTAEALERE